jgi:hypothetical protein
MELKVVLVELDHKDLKDSKDSKVLQDHLM